MTDARPEHTGADRTSTAGPSALPPHRLDGRVAALPGPVTDLRRVGISPDHWYPVATSRKVRRNRTFAAVFAGERIALYRGRSGTVHALEDRCAHRQVPLSMGVVEGDILRCCYHAWAYRGDGRISQIPYLPKGCERPPRGVRSFPVREAYGLVFVFPGDPALAEEAPFPFLPEYESAAHRTMTFSRTVRCHYSFMHENLLDMNHQFLHRSVLGRIKPELLGYESGPRHVEARYLFVPAGGRKDRGAGLLSAEGVGGRDRPDVITIRTEYPYQTLRGVPEGNDLPAFSLWAAYVPEDAEQRVCHAYGLLTIAKPSVPGALELAWPLIRRFTERVFAQDRMAVEAEQRAWDEQDEDRNHEVFPLILDVRDVLRANGVPLRAEPSPGCGPCGLAGPQRAEVPDRVGAVRSSDLATEGAAEAE
ncbi:aromatic ring-hydroxylating oxygenase subunit alpha [Streptomyces fructofermentans]|uniref:3-chlorobenzoate-3,4-dioxygenase n=1 Tax=Streptomyces fructofermentans TaxID=152141 RepID=A0A918U1X1_9ACTN|nr:aromatic ring-hydroxylating dioxygenase subunit alpha [Streptomyces fructofermentans]GGX82638.1 3-chlorobenzoate-3,4-dioxygenase [Streptomyces fructofermentans]